MAFNSSRNTRLFTQIQSVYNAFNNTTGTWNNTGAKLQRIPENGFSMERLAPYTPYPAVTGDRSMLPGVRARKAMRWVIRGIPVVPSGAAGTVPDLDHILQSAFCAVATVVASTSATYALGDTGAYPLSLFDFRHGSTTLTSRAMWGGTVTRVVFVFNGPYLTMDVEGTGGYAVDSAAFSAFDTQAKAGLTAFPIEVVSPSVNGTPIQGFGNGWTTTIHSQSIELKVRAMSVTFDTGNILVSDVYGSPYPQAIVGGTRRVALALGALDDDSSALNDLKTQCDTDGSSVNATIVAGATAGSILTWTVKNIQPNAFNLRDDGPMVSFDLPSSDAHESSIGALDDLTLAFT